ncbi:MAG: hypothetical protein AAB605_03510 [Patescibacteria group bacterium]
MQKEKVAWFLRTQIAKFTTFPEEHPYVIDGLRLCAAAVLTRPGPLDVWTADQLVAALRRVKEDMLANEVAALYLPSQPELEEYLAPEDEPEPAAGWLRSLLGTK